MSDLEIESNGRKFVIGKVGVGGDMRNIRAIAGHPGLAENEQYMLHVRIMSSIKMIDGVPRPAPSAPEHYEATADLVGDCLKDVMVAYAKIHGVDVQKQEAIETAKN